MRLGGNEISAASKSISSQRRLPISSRRCPVKANSLMMSPKSSSASAFQMSRSSPSSRTRSRAPDSTALLTEIFEYAARLFLVRQKERLKPRSYVEEGSCGLMLRQEPTHHHSSNLRVGTLRARHIKVFRGGRRALVLQVIEKVAGGRHP